MKELYATADAATASADGAAEVAEKTDKLLEVGWIIAGRLDPADRQAVERARDRTLAQLRRNFPSFNWRMPLLERDELVSHIRTQPTRLLEYGLSQRNALHWDFTILITGADLVSYLKPFAFAAVSRALDAVVISTSRLDPRAIDPTAGNELRTERMADRIAAITLHALGHLNGLSHESHANNYMFDADQPHSFDAMSSFTEEQQKTLQSYFQEAADLRLEEHPGVRNVSPWVFYLKSTWINRREIANAFLQAKPWQFPFQLSRVTVASLSTMLVMLLTAEAWDLGMNQPLNVTVSLTISVLLATTTYVVFRQRLILRRTSNRLSEQTVLTNVSTFAIVAGGMLTTFVLVLLLASAIMLSLFHQSLVERWAESNSESIHFVHYLKLAMFVASMALGVGSLGASFEGQHYFRHVTYVDEEI